MIFMDSPVISCQIYVSQGFNQKYILQHAYAIAQKSHFSKPGFNRLNFYNLFLFKTYYFVSGCIKFYSSQLHDLAFTRKLYWDSYQRITCC